MLKSGAMLLRYRILNAGAAADAVRYQMARPSPDHIVIIGAGAAGLKRLGRMIWKEVDAGDEVSCIDVRQAIISLLQQAGRPLQTDEIRQRLVAFRGVNEYFQIATVRIQFCVLV